MRRRTVPQPTADKVPEALRSMAGVRAFMDPLDAAGGDWLARYLPAFHRWLAARKQWCADRGLDYVDTFHPEWRPR